MLLGVVCVPSQPVEYGCGTVGGGTRSLIDSRSIFSFGSCMTILLVALAASANCSAIDVRSLALESWAVELHVLMLNDTGLWSTAGLKDSGFTARLKLSHIDIRSRP